MIRRVIVRPHPEGLELYMGSRLGTAWVRTWDEAESAARDLVGRSGKSIAFLIAWDFDGIDDPRGSDQRPVSRGICPRCGSSMQGGSTTG